MAASVLEGAGAASSVVSAVLADAHARGAPFLALAARAVAWQGIVKLGRTHLMDAVPVTLGQEFSAYARQVMLGAERLRDALPRLLSVPQGMLCFLQRSTTF